LRLLGTAVAASTAALIASGTLGVAAAEAPTIVPNTRVISVGGVGNVPIAQDASEAAAIAAYRQGMAAAVTDGQAKAQFLAEKTGVALGAVVSVTEGGGGINCTGGDEETGYAEYRGAQPDFSSGGVSGPVPLLRGAAAPVARAPLTRKHRRHRRSTVHAKAAIAVSCKLSAAVQLVYAIG
jgi:Protein of unknown function (DUF541)